MKTIGFAGTFYTLWDVQVERVNVALGAWYDKVTCTYYKNLSKSLNEAIEKAGTSNVDESLRGKRKSFEYKKPLVVEPKIMADCERLFWVLFRNDKAHLAEGVRQAAFDRALELGYLSIIEGDFTQMVYCTGEVIKTNIAYKWIADLRNEDLWRSPTLDKYFIGII